MSSFFAFLRSRWVTTFLGAIVLALLIWFVGPLLGLGSLHPFETEIARYIELESPLDCAGSFKSEGLGVALFEAVESRDPTALVGLPLIWVAAALARAGLDPLRAR